MRAAVVRALAARDAVAAADAAVAAAKATLEAAREEFKAAVGTFGTLTGFAGVVFGGNLIRVNPLNNLGPHLEVVPVLGAEDVTPPPATTTGTSDLPKSLPEAKLQPAMLPVGEKRGSKRREVGGE